MACPSPTGKKELMLVVVAATLMLQHSTATDGAGNSRVAKPGCLDKCGNVSIPYPFGIRDKGCFREGLEVKCSPDNVAILAHSSEIPLLEINLNLGQARVQSNVARLRINITGPDDVQSFYFEVGPSFTVSGAKNMFTAIGCATVASIMRRPHEVSSITSPCGSFCYQEDRINNGTKCFGRGCCQSPIPESLNSFYPAFLHDLGNPEVKKFSPCSYAFVAEEGSFEFDRSYVKSNNFEKHYKPRLVLDWVVGQETCVEAKKKDTGSSYACASTNSVCIDVPGRGYRCSCSAGYDGNPYLDGGCKDIDECGDRLLYPCKSGHCRNTIGSYTCSGPSGTQSKDPKNIPCTTTIGLTIGIGLGSATIFISLVLIAIFLTKRFKRRRARKLKQKFFELNRGQLLKQLVSQRADIGERMIITLDELDKATNNFDKARELGGGGHGTVYKGILSDLHVVAIKKSNIAVQKEINEFVNEVAILSQINHKNIVKLIGCCLETEVPLLVYEFISNGTLYHHLHVEGPRSLSWANRLRIAAEIANALSYLHSSVSIPIIHRDIKSSNTLLDDNLTSKVSDFGASRYIPIEKSRLTTMVQGTMGYLDPVYFYTGRLNDKSDVYSFGVVLVELLTRKKTFPYLSSEGEGLIADFASLHGTGNLIQILDPQVIEEGDNEVQAVAQLAASCINLRGEDRPTMRQVDRSLEGILSPEKFVEDSILVANAGQITRLESSKWHSL